MSGIIKALTPGGAAEKTGIRSGDELISINGRKVGDLIDYRYLSYDAVLRMVLKTTGGKFRLVRIIKREGDDPGLEFEDILLDKERSCANKCIFCFIDQLPRGMRKTLYYKDDDTRLSFLQGNYVTLTNMNERELRRIIDLRVSPINVSVHTMNPTLRSYMLGSENGGAGVAVIKRLAGAGITMHCQIVCCPGINDGAELEYTMRELYKLYPGVASVSVVPVGLTKHREGLCELKPYDGLAAAETLRAVEPFAERCLAELGSRVFFCADELYIKAGREIPPDEYYEDYPQLENGVGMLRLLITEFEDALAASKGVKVSGQPFTIATGMSAKPYIETLVYTAKKKYDIINGNVTGVKNGFFGESIDVAGLITGGDILKALSGHAIGARLLIPGNMLRAGEAHGGGVFLDNVTVDELSERLGVPVRVVKQDGRDLLYAVIGE